MDPQLGTFQPEGEPQLLDWGAVYNMYTIAASTHDALQSSPAHFKVSDDLESASDGLDEWGSQIPLSTPLSAALGVKVFQPCRV